MRFSTCCLVFGAQTCRDGILDPSQCSIPQVVDGKMVGNKNKATPSRAVMKLPAGVASIPWILQDREGLRLFCGGQPATRRPFRRYVLPPSVDPVVRKGHFSVGKTKA